MIRALLIFLLSSIHIYGICIVLGIIISHYLCDVFLKYYDISLYKKQILDVIFPALFINAYFGARLLFIILYTEKFFSFNSLLLFFFPWKEGFALIGSLIFIFFYLIYLYYKKNIPFNFLFSYLPIFVLIIHSFGRIGCYYAYCCGGNTFVSLQIISALSYAIFFLVGYIYLLYSKKKDKGWIFYFLALIMDRFFLEIYRDDKIIIITSYITVYHILLLSFIIVFLLFYFFKKNNKK